MTTRTLKGKAEKNFDQEREEAFSNEGAPAPASGPADEPEVERPPPGGPAKDAALARASGESAPVRVCSLLSDKLLNRGN